MARRLVGIQSTFACVALFLSAPLEPRAIAQAVKEPSLTERPVRLFVLDVKGDGIRLTSAADGVMFDVDNSGNPVRTAWTAPDTDDAFVVVTTPLPVQPRGGDLLGTGMRLPDGRRLFNPDKAVLAVQGIELDANFRILNRSPDLVVTLGPEDKAFERIRLWADRNHNGLCESTELTSMREAGIKTVNSGFRVTRVVDAHGNILGPRGNFAVTERGLEIWRDLEVVQFAR